MLTVGYYCKYTTVGDVSLQIVYTSFHQTENNAIKVIGVQWIHILEAK